MKRPDMKNTGVKTAEMKSATTGRTAWEARMRSAAMINTEKTNSLQPVTLYLLALSEQLPAEDALGWLSASERHQAESFSREASRNRYLQVRAAVRYCLAQHAGCTPQQLVIERSEAGKPQLVAPRPLFFSISHSDDQLAIAITTAGDIGIDLERIAARRPCAAIAERYFHPHETDKLQQLPAAEQTPFFFDLWTLKEAFFKAIGTGISSGLDKARFTLAGESITATFDPSLHETETHWQFQQWSSGAGYKMALALRHPLPPLVKQAVQLQWLQLPVVTGQQIQAATFSESAAT